MTGAAEFRAEQPVKLALGGGLIRLEPERGVAAGNNILLYAEVADVKRVQHILTAHDQLDRLAGGDIKVVAGGTVWILEDPVPARGGDIDLVGVRGRRPHVDEAAEAHEEDHHDDDGGKDRPTELEHRVVTRPAGVDLATLLSVLPHEVQHDADDEEEEEVIDVVDELEDPVVLAREGGCALWEPKGLRCHSLAGGESGVAAGAGAGLQQEGGDQVRHGQSPLQFTATAVAAGAVCKLFFFLISAAQNTANPPARTRSVTSPPIDMTRRACST